MKSYDKLYIGGEWVKASGEGRFEVTDSGTEEVFATIPVGAPSDVERAVRSARAAFEDWSRRSPSERAAYSSKIEAGLSARKDELATTIAREVGMPLSWAGPVQVGLPISTFRTARETSISFEYERQIGNSLVLREPVGVVGAITPWNYPLHQIAAKVAPALAAGCTVVLKPSEVAPLSAFVLAEVIDEAGLPPGVFNLVSGDGATVGEAIASHPGVDMISFTGSTRAGRRVSELAAKTIKRVALELGGKSANIILDDANLKSAVQTGVANCFSNSGQTCSAWTRMLVPRAKQEEALSFAKERAERFKLGNPLEPGVTLGPLASSAQRERVWGYIRKGVEEGAQLITGGAEPPEGLLRGYFVKPTIFSNVTSEMTIAQEEIFGPVLSVMPYDDEEEAIELANRSIYGLSGAVWSADPERAKRVAKRIRTGQIDVNGGRFNPLAPFGGYKQSGRGRELGVFGFEEYLEIKSLQL